MELCNVVTAFSELCRPFDCGQDLGKTLTLLCILHLSRWSVNVVSDGRLSRRHQIILKGILSLQNDAYFHFI
jgi:hypothetical protein